MAVNPKLEQEISVLMRKFRAVADDAKRDGRAILEYAAGPMVSAIAAAAPVSDEVHFRYSTAKANKSIRAPKGKGNIAAEYHPGNLERSIRTLKFRRSDAVFVGPKLTSGSRGVFKGARTDAYYAHMVEFGTEHSQPTPFVRPAVLATQSAVLRTAVDIFKRNIESEARRKGL